MPNPGGTLYLFIELRNKHLPILPIYTLPNFLSTYVMPKKQHSTSSHPRFQTTTQCTLSQPNLLSTYVTPKNPPLNINPSWFPTSFFCGIPHSSIPEAHRTDQADQLNHTNQRTARLYQTTYVNLLLMSRYFIRASRIPTMSSQVSRINVS